MGERRMDQEKECWVMPERYFFRGKAFNDHEDLYLEARIKKDDWVIGMLAQMLSEISSLRVIFKEGTLAQPVRVDTKTVSQCIGKRDKNKDLIFETDVLRDDGFIGDNGVHYYDTILIDHLSSRDGDYSDYAIIGNIIDNPELLKEISE